MTMILPEFVDSVKFLNLSENNAILNHAENLPDPVEIVLHKFKCHPYFIEIKKKIFGESKFSFSKITVADIRKENLDIKRMEPSQIYQPSSNLRIMKQSITKIFPQS